MPRVLVLGGTGWLGRHIVEAALARGADVTCLARGESGTVPAGARLLVADRLDLHAYDVVADRDWDAVIDVSWQPGMVRSAVAALADRAAHWTYVSSCSVYRRTDILGQDESAELHESHNGESADPEHYGPAKVACERIVVAGLGERALLARAGLIAGPGDPSDRFGYWVSRFALARDEAVLVPLAPDLYLQVIDVRILADWIVEAPGGGVHGAVNAVGERLRLHEVLSLAARTAGHRGSMRQADPGWLTEQGVAPWSGPRSLPLWLPVPEFAGFGARSGARARRFGLPPGSIETLLVDTLADERARGLGRERRAGLSRAEELVLIDLLTPTTSTSEGHR